MTHTSTEQPVTLRLADIVERLNVGVHSQAIAEEYSAAARELRRLHARVQELEAAQAQRAPLSVEDVYDITRNDGPELLTLAQKWMDNEIHAYQYASQAEAIVDRAVRATEAAHGITQEKQG